MSTIYLSPSTLIRENLSTGTIIIGQPGSGKTVAMTTMAANQLMMGEQIIAIDPKDDFVKLKNVMPQVDIINIQDIHEGSLNPFTFLDNVTPNTLMAIIRCLCGDLPMNAETYLIPVLKDFINKAQLAKRDENLIIPSLTSLERHLRQHNNDAVRNVGAVLNAQADSSFGKLLFTPNTKVEPLQLPKDKSFVISILGMSLPNYTKKVQDYTADERFSSTVVFLLCQKLIDILSDKNKKRPVTLYLDEAHVLFSNREMTQVINQFLSMGRSLKVATVLGSQGMEHFPEQISQYISNKLMFKSSKDQAMAFLERFDTGIGAPLDKEAIAATMTNIDNINGELVKGNFFLIDRKNRSGFCHLDPFGPEIL
jgi:hypothetical protein